MWQTRHAAKARLTRQCQSPHVNDNRVIDPFGGAFRNPLETGQDPAVLYLLLWPKTGNEWLDLSEGFWNSSRIAIAGLQMPTMYCMHHMHTGVRI